MNVLIAGADQVFESQGWIEKLCTPILHTGNEIDVQEIVHFSSLIDLANLRVYRQAVAASTRQVVSQLTADTLGQMVDSRRIDKLRALKVVLDPGILSYWSRRTFAGLLLMPPTRHCFTHLNEALRIKHSLQR